MTDSQKIREIEKHLNLSTNALAKSLGLKTSQTLYDIHKGKHGISKDLAEIISTKYLNINLLWLLTGKGEMLNKSDSLDEKVAGKVIAATKTEASTERNMNSDYKNLIETIRFLSETVNSQQRTIEQLQVEVKKLNVPKEGNVGCADVG